MSMDGCGKAGLGCKPSGFLCFLCVLFFFFFPSEALVGKPRKTHRFIPGAGCHVLLQEAFLARGWNPGLLHRRQTLDRVSHQGSSVRNIHQVL